MKKLYMRAGMSPTDIYTPTQVLMKNSIGGNVGNLIYAYGVFRALTVEGTEIIPNYYKVDAKKADEINEQYDAFIIPLADAFRPDFQPELEGLTKLVKKLTIPCVVTGVGLRAPFEPDFENGFPFDEGVKNFIKAVLEKSAIVGVRGEITSRYLTSLGFKEGTDHMPIGCPSMYTYGKNLNIRDVNLTKDSKVSINSSLSSPVTVLDFLDRVMKQIPDHYFLPQLADELRLVYTGAPYGHNQPDKLIYPDRMTSDVYRENRVRFPLNAPTWIDFLRGVDFSIGGRLHGNIVATIAGTPNILIPHDARMRELSEYHDLTRVWASEIDEKTDVFELAAKMDFHSAERVHERNFNNYIDFLDKNGLDHIYKNGANPETAPMDRIVAEAGLLPPAETIANCSLEELTERWQDFYPPFERDRKRLKNEVKSLRRKTGEQDSKINSQDKKINDLNAKVKDLKAESAGFKKEAEALKKELAAIEAKKLKNRIKRVLKG